MTFLPGGLLPFLVRLRECFAEAERSSVTCSSAQNGALYMKDNFARSESHVEQGLVLQEPLPAVLTGSLPSAWCPGCSRGGISGLPFCVPVIVLSLLDGDSPNLPLVHAAGSPAWLTLNLQKFQDVPGEQEVKGGI